MIVHNQTPEHVLDRLELGLRTRDDLLAAIADPKYGRLKTRLLRQLENSRDWLPGIADEFTTLLDTTIRFAYLCYDVGRKMGGSYTEYLRKRDKDQKKQKVDEALFHQHYREILQFSALFGIVASEVIDKAGGRTDILVSFGAVQFNVECKIEEDDASETALRQYVAQAAEYQNTNAGFAILLALDKTVDAEGAANLFDSLPCLLAQSRTPGTPFGRSGHPCGCGNLCIFACAIRDGSELCPVHPDPGALGENQHGGGEPLGERKHCGMACSSVLRQ